MLQRKRKSLDSECVRDSQQITLSPVGEGETEFAMDSCRVRSLPLRSLWVFKLARDLRISFYCEDIKVEAEVIGFHCLVSGRLCFVVSFIAFFLYEFIHLVYFLVITKWDVVIYDAGLYLLYLDWKYF